MKRRTDGQESNAPKMKPPPPPSSKHLPPHQNLCINATQLLKDPSFQSALHANRLSTSCAQLPWGDDVLSRFLIWCGRPDLTLNQTPTIINHDDDGTTILSESPSIVSYNQLERACKSHPPSHNITHDTSLRFGDEGGSGGFKIICFR